MCRNIKPLFNFDPPATEAEIHDAALQFVRKLSGTNKPSKRNEAAFDHAVLAIAKCAADLATAPRPRGRGGQGKGAFGAQVCLRNCRSGKIVPGAALLQHNDA